MPIVLAKIQVDIVISKFAYRHANHAQPRHNLQPLLFLGRRPRRIASLPCAKLRHQKLPNMSGPQSGNWRQNDNWRVPGPPRSDPGPAFAGNPPPLIHNRTDATLLARVIVGSTAAGSSEGSQDLIAEGRRVYLGNLLCRVKPYKVEEMLAANGLEGQST